MPHLAYHRPEVLKSLFPPRIRIISTLLFLVLLTPACGGPDGEARAAGQPDETPHMAPDAVSVQDLAELGLPVLEPWTGDLPGMLERKVIRALVPWSDSYYYLDGVEQKGIAFEAVRIFEAWLNQEFQTGNLAVHVMVVPTQRDLLFRLLNEGRGDMALGGITITASREERVAFTDPISKPLDELVVAAPSSPRLARLEDLSGQAVHVRPSSSYWNSLVRLNDSLAAQGLASVQLVAAPEFLSTEDLMQMANADLVPYTIADDSIARYWGLALPDVTVYTNLAVREGARMGWAVRQESPELLALLNRFVAGHKEGTLIGNVVANRYLKDPKRLHNVNAEADRARLEQVYDYFQTHTTEYGFDTLMVLAQGFQESRLDQSRRSHRGAIGIMQLMPATAADPVVGIEDISTADNNILAGVRYLHWIRNTYLDEANLDPFNQTLFAFASYNAGPQRIKTLRARAAERGLDPNVWFDNVELMAAEDIGRETVEYVSNIYKYYVAYTLLDLYRGEGPG